MLNFWQLDIGMRWQWIDGESIDGKHREADDIGNNRPKNDEYDLFHKRVSGLTKKAEPPPTRGVDRDSGTDNANGVKLRRLVRRQHTISI